MPHEMTKAHIVPGLAHSSLISTKKFCEVGCKVVFDETECRVYYKGELVLSGGRDKKTEMWQLPINTVSKNYVFEGLDLPITAPRRGAITQARHNTIFAIDVANNLHTLPYKHKRLKCMHLSFFSPPIQTIAEASNNKQLEGIPCLNSPKIVQKYLAPSPATSKGRPKKNSELMRARLGLR